MHIRQSRNGSVELDITHHDVVAVSQSGTLERTVGLTGAFTARSALEVPDDVNVDVRFTTYLSYIKSFYKSVLEEPDRIVRANWNDRLRKYTCGTKYYKEWRARRIREAVAELEAANAESQSGELRTEGATTTAETDVEQTVEFQTDVDQVHVSIDSKIDSTRLQAGTKGAALGDWLSRPVRLATHILANGSYLDVQFNPWFDFLDNTIVKDKLKGYSLLSGDLHVKFMVNGGPFYYGSILVGYKPQGTGYDFLGTATNDYFDRCVLLSQRQHLCLNPTTSQGGEMKLPFFHHKNYLDLTRGSDAVDMGAIDMISLAPLQRVLGSTDASQINITVVAWMSNVQLAAPTSMGIFSQSGKLDGAKDEYGKGIISKPASAIASFAGKLKIIPQIAPYATATQMIASGIGNLAQLFGFSRPVNLEPVRRYKPLEMGILANSSIEEATEKLTFDPKQELTIDHNITGASLNDEMTIKALTSKSSLIGQFDWQMRDAEETKLQTIFATPISLMRRDVSTEYGYEYFFTPLTHASIPFKYWRGGLIYRFQIMASDLHRGRLLVVYDPKGFSNDSFPDLNSTYCRILDLEETKDFTLPVYWMQDKSWQQVDHSLGGGYMGDFSGSSGYVDENMNGALRVFVLNELTGPDEDQTNYVRINVYLSGAEDYEVAGLDSHALDNWGFGGDVPGYSTLEVNGAWSQSGLLNNAKTARESQPGHDGSEMLEAIGQPTQTDALALVYFGEKFVSFRDMLKRYNLANVFARSYDDTKTGRSTKYQICLPNFPMYRGRADTNGMYQVARGGGLNAVNFNPIPGTLMNWLTPAFAARRGGIRYKYMLGEYSDVHHTKMVVSRGDEWFDDNIGTSESVLDTPTSNDHAPYSATSRNLWQGGALTTGNGLGVEVELPYYTNKKFSDASTIDTATFGDQKHYVEVFDGNRQTHGDFEVFQYVAAGEDFNLSWYVNAPRVFYFDPPLITTSA